MSSTFTPSSTFQEDSEKEWPAKLGGLDWDKTNIVFTKRSLIEFLRYAGVSLDTNFRTISKLPRYAQFGRMDSEGGADSDTAAPEAKAEIIAPADSSGSTPFINDYKPSRRVRTAPGGAQTFKFDDLTGDTLPGVKGVESLSIADEKPADNSVVDTNGPPEENSTSTNAYKPTRRVRTAPGGQDSLASLWSDNAKVEAEIYRPTRRVREGPGGTDSISQIF